MACQYNAKFTFDSAEGITYEETTAPLRRLLKKDVKFHWDEKEDKSYVTLMKIMNDPATLQPFHIDRKTHDGGFL